MRPRPVLHAAALAVGSAASIASPGARVLLACALTTLALLALFARRKHVVPGWVAATLLVPSFCAGVVASDRSPDATRIAGVLEACVEDVWEGRDERVLRLVTGAEGAAIVATTPDPDAGRWLGHVVRAHIRWPENGARARIAAGMAVPLAQRCSPTPSRMLRQVRAAWGAQLTAHMSRDSAVIARAMTVGGQEAIPWWIQDLYRRAGLSHILSISGLHLGVMLMIARALASRSVEPLWRRLGLPRASWWSTGLGLLAAAVVMMGAPGMGAPRALVMACLWSVATFWGERAPMLERVGAAAFVLAALDPSSAWSVSFQLTFAAVIGVWAGLQFSARFGAKRSRVFRAGARLLGVSICVWLATAPFSAFHFSEVTALAPLANLVVTPWLTLVVTPLLVGAALTAWVAPVSTFLLGAADSALSVSLVVTKWLVLHAGSSAFVPRCIALAWILATLVVITALARGSRGSRTLLAATFAVAVPLIYYHGVSGAQHSITLRVGKHGHTILDRCRDGRAYLRNAGGGDARSFWRGEPDPVSRAVLLPALRRDDVHSVARLTLSNEKWQNIGGALALVSIMPVEEIEFARVPAGPIAQELVRRMEVEGGRIRVSPVAGRRVSAPCMEPIEK